MNSTFVSVVGLSMFIWISKIIGASLFPLETVQSQGTGLMALSAEHAALLALSTHSSSTQSFRSQLPCEEDSDKVPDNESNERYSLE
jgi:hypothetical protein